MFQITRGCGFQMAFENGVTVSIQFGPGHYCDHHHSIDVREGTPSKTAETAVFTTKGRRKWLRPPWDADNDDVQGWQTPAQVARLIEWASKLPPQE